MSLKSTSTRDILTYMYHTIPQEEAGWIQNVSGTPIDSDQEIETYGGLGSVGPLRAWNGQRAPQRLRDITHTIRNVSYEKSLIVYGNEMRRNKTGQVQRRIDDLGARYRQHWAVLATDLVKANGTCYDGQAFFADAHAENGVTTGDNNLGASATSAAAPTVSEFEQAIWDTVEQFHTFLDDSGEPAHDDPRSFTLLVKPSMLRAAAGSLNAELIDGGDSNVLVSYAGYQFNLVALQRLAITTAGGSALGNSFVMMVNDGRSLIRQEEMPLKVTMKGPGSDFEHDHDAHEYGVHTIRGAGYGDWRSAVKTTFS